jgi:glycosyltransferase involved in cell wall biosynthesis
VVGDAGVILPEADETAWTCAIERLLANAALRREYAERGLARAAERFAWPVVARAHLDWFDEVIA